MFKHLLLPTDGSDASQAVLLVGQDLFGERQDVLLFGRHVDELKTDRARRRPRKPGDAAHRSSRIRAPHVRDRECCVRHWRGHGRIRPPQRASAP